VTCANFLLDAADDFIDECDLTSAILYQTGREPNKIESFLQIQERLLQQRIRHGGRKTVTLVDHCSSVVWVQRFSFPTTFEPLTRSPVKT
jgi:hypothetical protein